MSALNPYTGTTELEELVPTEIIPQVLDGYPWVPTVGREICRRIPGVGSIATRFPRWNAITVPAGTKAQTDGLTDANIDTTESTITPGIVGLRLPVSLEGETMTVFGSGIEMKLIEQVVRALRNRRDSDILSSNTSATNTAGAVTDNFDTSKLRAALAAARALHFFDGGEEVAMVVHDDGYRDLEESMGASAATLMSRDAANLKFGAVAGYHGSYGEGVHIFSSGNTPAESSNWSGCITPIGAASGLGFVESKDITHFVTKGDDAGQRLVTYHVFYLWFGVGVANPNQLLEILHRT